MRFLLLTQLVLRLVQLTQGKRINEYGALQVGGQYMLSNSFSAQQEILSDDSPQQTAAATNIKSRRRISLQASSSTGSSRLSKHNAVGGSLLEHTHSVFGSSLYWTDSNVTDGVAILMIFLFFSGGFFVAWYLCKNATQDGIYTDGDLKIEDSSTPMVEAKPEHHSSPSVVIESAKPELPNDWSTAMEEAKPAQPNNSAVAMEEKTPEQPNATATEEAKPKQPQPNSGTGVDTSTAFDKEFEIVSGAGETRIFKWIIDSEENRLAFGTTLADGSVGELARHSIKEGGSADLIPAPWSSESVKELLMKNGVNASNWPPLKVQSLLKELTDGRAFLMRSSEEGHLKRIMQIVLVVVFHPATGKVIVPQKSFSKDFSQSSRALGNMATEFRRKIKTQQEVTPSIRRLPMERIEQTANRCILEKLSAPAGMIEVTPSRIKTTELEETSDFYPGLTTVVCRHFIQARVVTSDEELLKHVGLSSLSNSTDEKYFETEYGGETFKWIWQLPEEVAGLRQHLPFLSTQGNPADSSSSRKSRVRSNKRTTIRRTSTLAIRDASLQVVLPWQESAVQELLEKYRASTEEFGLSLQELSLQASQGRLTFGKHGNDEKLVAIIDVLLLQLFTANSQGVLVQKCSTERIALPEVAFHLEEASWDAARRLGRSMLSLDDESVVINNSLTKLKQENLVAKRMLERRWLVSASLADHVDHMGDVPSKWQHVKHAVNLKNVLGRNSRSEG